MLNTAVSFFIYSLEMLISYIVFSFASDRRRSVPVTFLLGLAIYESGALLNLATANTVWVNFLYTMLINFTFAASCFHIKFRAAIVYAVLMNVFSVTFEFATIFAVSAMAGMKITDYNSNLSLLLMEAAISKALYLISCVALVRIPKNNAPIEKIPRSFYFFPFCVLLSLISFWYICAHESLNETNQLLMSIISIVLLCSTVFLFITYRHSMERDNEYIRVKSENDRLQTEKAHYDILERQNHQLMIYAHDTKNHLATIQSLSNNPEINNYIEKLLVQLKTYASSCHSGNNILDVIINKYVTECDLLGVTFDFDVRSCNLSHVEDIDLVAILGNLLDNALTAAEKSEQKCMSLETTTRNSYCVIIINNSCDQEPSVRETQLITTKEDKMLHGFGIKSVKKTLKKYRGDYNWDYDADKHCFTATVMLGSGKTKKGPN